MKKFISAAAAILLSAALLAGCGEPVEMTRGSIKENIYTSNYNGITFTAPEGWEYLSDEPLSVSNGGSSFEFADQGCGFPPDQYVLYEMSAKDVSSGTFIFVMYENLSLTHEGPGTSIEQYVENLKGRLAIDNAEVGAIYDTEISGHIYKALTVKASDKQFIIYSYYRKIDKFILIIMVTVAGEDDIDSVMANFS